MLYKQSAQRLAIQSNLRHNGVVGLLGISWIGIRIEYGCCMALLLAVSIRVKHIVTLLDVI